MERYGYQQLGQDTEQKVHYKLYKAKKKWLVQGISIVGATVGLYELGATTLVNGGVDFTLTARAATDDESVTTNSEEVSTAVTQPTPVATVTTSTQTATLESNNGTTATSDTGATVSSPETTLAESAANVESDKQLAAASENQAGDSSLSVSDVNQKESTGDTEAINSTDNSSTETDADASTEEQTSANNNQTDGMMTSSNRDTTPTTNGNETANIDVADTSTKEASSVHPSVQSQQIVTDIAKTVEQAATLASASETDTIVHDKAITALQEHIQQEDAQISQLLSEDAQGNASQITDLLANMKSEHALAEQLLAADSTGVDTQQVATANQALTQLVLPTGMSASVDSYGDLIVTTNSNADYQALLSQLKQSGLVTSFRNVVDPNTLSDGMENITEDQAISLLHNAVSDVLSYIALTPDDLTKDPLKIGTQPFIFAPGMSYYNLLAPYYSELETAYASGSAIDLLMAVNKMYGVLNVYWNLTADSATAFDDAEQQKKNQSVALILNVDENNNPIFVDTLNRPTIRPGFILNRGGKVTDPTTGKAITLFNTTIGISGDDASGTYYAGTVGTDIPNPSASLSLENYTFVNTTGSTKLISTLGGQTQQVLVNHWKSNSAATTPTATDLTAQVGDVTKVYDGTTSFTSIPTITLGQTGMTVPTLTTSDFDWGVLSADVAKYAVTLNVNGIQKILAANADTTLTAANVTAGKAEITPKAITITANNADKMLGEADPTLTAAVDSGVVNGDSLNYSVTRASGEITGTYPITVQLGTNSNYNITTKDGTFTIKAPTITNLTAQVGNVTKAYDGNAKFNSVPTVTLGQAGMTTPTLTVADFNWNGVSADAATYSVTLSTEGIQKILAANANTALTNATITAGKAEITPKAVTITADNTSKTVGEADPTLTATVGSGVISGETLNYTVDRTNGETVGTYTITVHPEANKNYTITPADGVFTINEPTITNLTAQVGNVTKVYDGTANFTDVPSVTLGQADMTMPMLTVADFDWSDVSANVDMYNVTLNADGVQKILAANPNTAFSTTGITAGKAAITPKEVTITADSTNKTVGEVDPTLTATVGSGIVSGETLNYTVDRASGETAGTYVITVHPGTNGNYKVATVDGTFTINAPSVMTLTARVGDVTKVYDGTANFTDVPLVTLNQARMTVPALTVADFDWSDVSADAATYNVTLNADGIQKILTANVNTALTTAGVTAGKAEITPKSVTITADNASKTVGEADPTLTATVGNGVVSGENLAYTVDRTRGETVGTYTVTVHPGANTNYKLTLIDGKFTINAPTITTLTAQVGDVTKIYDGTATFSDVPTVTLKQTGMTMPTLTTADFDWSDVSTDAATYNVTLNADGIQKILSANANTALTAAGVTAGKAEITPATVTVTADDVNKTVGDTDPTLTATIGSGVVNGDTLNYSIDRDSGETAGTYTITVHPGTNANYEITPVTGVFTINAPTTTTLTAQVGDVTKTYDGTTIFNDVPTVTLDQTSMAVPTLTTADFDWSDVSANADTYNVTLNADGIQKILAANADTALTAAGVTAGKAEITPKAVTITADNASKTVGDTDPTLTATVGAGVVNGETLTYTVDRASGETAGTYPITVHPDTNANYTITPVEGLFTINAPTVTNLTAQVGDVTKTYDGTTTFNDVPTVTLNQTSMTVPTLTISDFDWSDVSANAGTYNVTLNADGIQKILAANADTALTAAGVTAGRAEITPKKVTVTADDANKTVGDTDPTLTATVGNGVVNGETLIYTVNRDSGETAGTYTITVHPETNPNYEITLVAGKFTINAPTITTLTAQVGDVTKTYDGTATFSDVPSVTLDQTSMTVPTLTTADFDWNDVSANAGTYNVTLNADGIQKILVANANTALTAAGVTAGKAEITPKAVTITADNANKTVGDADPTLTATVGSGVVNGERLTYTVDRASGETVGTYPITVHPDANANYTITPVDSTFTINAPAITTLTAQVGDVTKAYDGTASFTDVPSVTLGQANMTVPALTTDDFDWSDVSANAATYNITLTTDGIQKILSANANTALSESDVVAGKAEITPVAVTITADNANKVVGDVDPTLTATVGSGVVNGETLTYTVDRASGETVGTYPITVHPDANANYTITAVDGTFTISEPVITNLTAQVGSVTKVYDGTTTFDDVPTVTVDQAGMKVPTLTTADFDWSNVQADVAAYDVTLNADGIQKILTANANTTLTTDNVTAGQAEITPAAMKVVLNNDTVNYNGTNVFTGPDVTVKDTPNFNPVTLTSDDFDWQSVQPNVGTYTLTLSAAGKAKLLAANPNMTLSDVDIQAGQLAVTKADVTLTPTAVSKYVGAADPDLQSTVGVTYPANGVHPVFTVSRQAGEIAGTYDIAVTADTAANPNYKFNVGSGAGLFTIKANTATLTVSDTGTKVYDGTTDLTGSLHVEAVGTTAVSMPNLQMSDFELADADANVGIHEVTLSASGMAKLLAANPNYTADGVTVAAGQYTITPAAVTVIVNDAEKTVGDNDPAFSTTSNKPAQGTPVEVTYSREAGETAGHYAITATADPAANANYTVTVQDGTLTINPVAITTLQASVGDVTKGYDGTSYFDELPVVTLDGQTNPVSGLTDADFNWSGVAKNVGQYQITLNDSGLQKIMAANPNTSLALGNVTTGQATITPRAVTVTANSSQKVSGTVDSVLTATVSDDLVQGDQLDYTVTRAPGEQEGTYAITVQLGTNVNYNVTPVDGTFTITAPTVVALTATVGLVTKTYDGTTMFTSLPTVTLGQSGYTVPALTTDDFDWHAVQAAAGEYPVTLSTSGREKITAFNVNTSLSDTDVTAGKATILRQAVTITGNDVQKVVGTADPVLTATVGNNLVTGDTLNYTLNRTAGEAIGVYPVNVKLGENPNYEVTTLPGKLTIVAAPKTGSETDSGETTTPNASGMTSTDATHTNGALPTVGKDESPQSNDVTTGNRTTQSEVVGNVTSTTGTAVDQNAERSATDDTKVPAINESKQLVDINADAIKSSVKSETTSVSVEGNANIKENDTVEASATAELPQTDEQANVHVAGLGTMLLAALGSLFGFGHKRRKQD